MMLAYDQKFFRILIADENVTYRNNLAAKLRFEGYAVEFVEGGFHLLHLLEKNSDIGMVIIHENMMDMSSEEVISLVRVHHSKNQLPIVYISKSSSEEDIKNMILKGANEYVVRNANMKPVIDKAQKYFTLVKNSKE